MRILAIDLGKFRSTAVLGADSRRPTQSFRDVPTSLASLRELVGRTAPDLVVIEACPLAGAISDMLEAMHVRLAVVNAADDRLLRRDAKAKTDLRDAARLLDLAHQDPEALPTVFVPGAEGRRWRRMIAFRATLQARLVAPKNSLRAIFAERDVHLPAERRAWSARFRGELRAMVAALEPGDREVAEADLAQVELLESQLRAHTRALDEIAKRSEQVRLLRTALGVGPRIAEAFVAWVVDAARFKTGKRLGAYLGLAPKVESSGETTRHGSITRAGPAIVRWLLVQGAWIAARRKGSWAQATMLRISGGSKARRRIAITAVARQMAVRMWAMLRHKAAWREPEPREAAAAAR